MPPKKDLVSSLTDEIKYLLAMREREKKEARKRERKLEKKRKKKEQQAAAAAQKANGEPIDGDFTAVGATGTASSNSSVSSGDSSDSSSGSSVSTSSDDECDVVAGVMRGKGLKNSKGEEKNKGPQRNTAIVDFDDIISLYKAFRDAVAEVRREAYRAPNLAAVATRHQEHLVESLLSTPTSTPRLAGGANTPSFASAMVDLPSPPPLPMAPTITVNNGSFGGGTAAATSSTTAATTANTNTNTNAGTVLPVTILPMPDIMPAAAVSSNGHDQPIGLGKGSGGGHSSTHLAAGNPPYNRHQNSPLSNSGSTASSAGVFFSSGAGSTLGSPLRISLEQSLVSLRNFILKDMPDIKARRKTPEEVRARVRLLMSEPMRRIARMIYEERDANDFERVSAALVQFCDLALEANREEYANRNIRASLKFFSTGGGTSASALVVCSNEPSPEPNISISGSVAAVGASSANGGSGTPTSQHSHLNLPPAAVISQSPILPPSVGAIFGVSPPLGAIGRPSPHELAVQRQQQESLYDGDSFISSPALGAAVSPSPNSSGSALAIGSGLGIGLAGASGSGLNATGTTTTILVSPMGSATGMAGSGGGIFDQHQQLPSPLPMPRFGLGGSPPPTPSPSGGGHSKSISGAGFSQQSAASSSPATEVDFKKVLDMLVTSDELPDLKTTTAVVLACRDALAEETSLLSVPAPCVIVGDIHGQLNDLRRILRLGGPIGSTTYLFLGDYVDRGPASIHVMLLLAAAKVVFPDKIFLLRGNHESKNINSVYGFLSEIEKKYPKMVNGKPCTPRAIDLFSPVVNSNNLLFLRFNEMFKALPLAAIVDNSIFCVHGGLSRYLTSVEGILCVDRFREIDDGGALADLCWSDPAKIRSFQHNWRGSGCQFGADVTLEFLRKNNLRFVCRAHQCVKDGYQWSHDNRLVTVFSATDYCGLGNKAAIMRVEPMPNGVGRDKKTKTPLLSAPIIKGGESPFVAAVAREEELSSAKAPFNMSPYNDDSEDEGEEGQQEEGENANSGRATPPPPTESPRPSTGGTLEATTVVSNTALPPKKKREPFDGISFVVMEILDDHIHQEGEQEEHIVDTNSDDSPSPPPPNLSELPHHFTN